MSLQQKLKTLDQRPWTMTAVLPASQLFQLDLYAQIFLDSLRICTIDDEIYFFCSLAMRNTIIYWLNFLYRPCSVF